MIPLTDSFQIFLGGPFVRREAHARVRVDRIGQRDSGFKIRVLRRIHSVTEETVIKGLDVMPAERRRKGQLQQFLQPLNIFPAGGGTASEAQGAGEGRVPGINDSGFLQEISPPAPGMAGNAVYFQRISAEIEGFPFLTGNQLTGSKVMRPLLELSILS